MSGRTTHGYNACVRCDRNPLSYAILSKIRYIGHHRFLAKDKSHPIKYRRHVFNAKHENRDAPKRLTADELQVELEKVRHITPGNHPGNGSGKRKCSGVEERLLFTRRSTLWDLEYWKDLDLRHNLDVMHIKKNIYDSIIGTLLNRSESTRLNSSHYNISYAVFCLKKKNFFNDTATTEIYTLSLHDALPIFGSAA